MSVLPLICTFQRPVSAHGPWLHNIESGIDSRPSWIRRAVGAQGSPSGWNPAHHAYMRRIFEPFNNREPKSRVLNMTGITKTKPPDRNDWLSVILQIGGAGGDL